MSIEQSEIQKLIDSYQVIVLIGPGGVGKTTCSIATAIAAARQGKSVGLLSIDPAKRLAAALGMPLGNQLKKINLGDDSDCKGTVEAAMLDQKAVFDSMVMKNAPSEKVAKKILNHKLYVAASSKLAGPLEYMALAKLQEMVESGKYDLVVLDTPPDTHALDFLKRPNLLAGFMENKVMSWLVKPFYLASRLGAGKLFSTGEKLMGGLAKVTGFKALSILAEFLVLIQEVIDGFHRSGERIVEILRQKETGFFLVTTPTPAAGRSAENLAKQIVKMGYGLNLVLFNRCLPKVIEDELKDSSEFLKSDAMKVPLIEKLHKRSKGEIKIIEELKRYVSDLDDEAPSVQKIEEQDYELHSSEAIYKFAKIYEGSHL